MSTWLKSSSQTPPDKKLATRMKARSTSRKKITKMTDREKEDVRKTTFDIRKFFEDKIESERLPTEKRRRPLSPGDIHDEEERNSSSSCGSQKVSLDLKKSKENISSYDVEQSRLQDVDEGPEMKSTAAADQPRSFDGARRRGGAEYTGQHVVREARDDGGGRDTNVKCGVDGILNTVRDDVKYVRGSLDKSLDRSMDNVCVDYGQYPLGTHHEERGGDDDGDRGEGGLGEDEERTLQKSKPNEVGGGGLKAKIHLWEMKTGNVSNEKYMKSTESLKTSDTRRGFSDGHRKQNTAL